jgi:hypothetical protein
VTNWVLASCAKTNKRSLGLPGTRLDSCDEKLASTPLFTITLDTGTTLDFVRIAEVDAARPAVRAVRLGRLARSRKRPTCIIGCNAERALRSEKQISQRPERDVVCCRCWDADRAVEIIRSKVANLNDDVEDLSVGPGPNWRMAEIRPQGGATVKGFVLLRCAGFLRASYRQSRQGL